jgi:hypothetical protein
MTYDIDDLDDDYTDLWEQIQAVSRMYLDLVEIVRYLADRVEPGLMDEAIAHRTFVIQAEHEIDQMTMEKP